MYGAVFNMETGKYEPTCSWQEYRNRQDKKQYKQARREYITDKVFSYLLYIWLAWGFCIYIQMLYSEWLALRNEKELSKTEIANPKPQNLYPMLNNYLQKIK